MPEQHRIAVLEQAVAEPHGSGPRSTAALATWVEAEVERLGGLDKPRPRLSLTTSLPALAGWGEGALVELRRAAMVFRLSFRRWEVVRDGTRSASRRT